MKAKLTGSDRVRAAIEATRQHLRHHWKALLAQRAELSGEAVGSYVEGLRPEVLERVLQESVWEEDPSVQSELLPGTTAYRTVVLGGVVGVLPLDELPDGTELELRDGHSTGQVEPVAGGLPREVARSSNFWLILGQEEGREVVFTFHPGRPIQTPAVPADGNVGRRIGVEEAQGMGFTYAKLE